MNKFLNCLFFSTNHKDIGTLYFIFIAGVVGTLLSLFIFLKLTSWGNQHVLRIKKKAFNAIGGISFFIIPKTLAWNSHCILNEDERKNLYQETVQDFLWKVEASADVKDSLKTWAFKNTKSFLAKYDEGAAVATEYLSKNLEYQKEYLRLEELEKLKQTSPIEAALNQITKDAQGWGPWISEKITYFNPFVTDTMTCLKAWGVLVVVAGGAGFLIWCLNNNYDSWASLHKNWELTREINKNVVKNETNTQIIMESFKSSQKQVDLTEKTVQVLKETVHTQGLDITAVKEIITKSVESNDEKFNILLLFAKKSKEAITVLTKELTESQTKLEDLRIASRIPKKYRTELLTKATQTELTEATQTMPQLTAEISNQINIDGSTALTDIDQVLVQIQIIPAALTDGDQVLIQMQIIDVVTQLPFSPSI